MSEPMDQENFAIQLTDSCKTHEEWLSVMHFGMGTLLRSQPLLMECIVREAERECKRTGLPSRVPADHARAIMVELGLKFVAQ